MVKLSNAFNASRRVPVTPQGAAGYDNARENIDPHIKTKVVSSQEGSIERAPTADNHIANKKYVDDSLASVDLSGLVPYTGATSSVNVGANNITANAFLIDATINHGIGDDSDDLVLKNFNSDKDIVFNINRSGSSHNFIKIDSSLPQLYLGNDSSVAVGGNGLIKVGGTWSGGAMSAMEFSPNVSNNFNGFEIAPYLNGDIIFNGVKIAPTSGNNNRTNCVGVFYDTPTYVSGYNETHTMMKDVFDRLYQFGDNYNLTGLSLGGSTLFVGFTAAPTVVDNMIKLTGGLMGRLGALGSIAQKGIYLTGFGTLTGILAADSVYSVYADGGLFANAYDYSATNMMLFGAGNDSAIGYDGDDFVIDSALVGTGVVKFANATNWTANGTNTVTVGNVAPAGVGTATISKWFTVKDNAGTVFYIPAWT